LKLAHLSSQSGEFLALGRAQHVLASVGAGANMLSFGQFQNAEGDRGVWRDAGAGQAGVVGLQISAWD
jgi:hypothetical protein